MSSRSFNRKWVLGGIVVLEVATWGTLKTFGWDTMIALALSVLLMSACCAVGALAMMGLWHWSRRGFRYKTSQLLVLMVILCVVVAGLTKLYVQPYLQRQGVEALSRNGVRFYDLTNQLVGPGRIINDDEVSSLSLSNDDMVRSAIPYLGRFGNLDDVSLGGDVTDESLESLKSANLSHDLGLTLWGHKLTDNGLKHLCDFPSVRSLCINGPAVTHRGIAALMEAEHLEHVMLIEEGAATLTHVDDALIGPISSMDNVRSLVVIGPGITDASISVFAQLPNLEKLVLRGTQVSSDGKARLESVLKGCRVSMD